MKKSLGLILVFTVVLLLLSLTQQNSFNSGGFFSFYHGEAKVFYGWPFSSLECFDTVMNPYGESGCSLRLPSLLYSFSFWFSIAVAGYAFVYKIVHYKEIHSAMAQRFENIFHKPKKPKAQ